MNIKKLKNIVKTISISSLLAISISCFGASAGTVADHKSEIKWDRGYRWVDANTQAYYKSGNGTKSKVASYTRARFEWFGSAYCDSGRKWGTGTGKSYATSGKELYKDLDSGVAKSYWGTE